MMHGRLKVKSTAQQKAEREEAQRKKLATYQAGFSKVMSERQAGSLDKDILASVAAILEKNPDVGVLWIYRREIFQSMRETLPSEDVQAILDSELEFLVACLRVNPKSYFTWAHRCWVLLNAPTPNWDRELALCTRFLSLDERNFHCWDYRRWLVEQMGVCSEKELEFVTAKLYENFSNFSAWHYRSRLLPKAVSSEAGRQQDLPKGVLMEELDLVRNALFVDPTDQSPWFYYRWLLSNCTTRPVLPHSCLVTREPSALRVAFSRPVSLAVARELKVSIERQGREVQELSNLEWKPNQPRKASALWIAALPDLEWASEGIVVESGEGRLKCELLPGLGSVLCQTNVDPLQFFPSVCDVKLEGLINDELGSIRELHSMESSSKWVVLGLCSLLRLAAPLTSEHEVCCLIDKLRAADPLRKSYYNDYRSRILAENQVIRCFQASLTTFSLTDRGITALSVTAWLQFFSDVDLSDNQLKTLPQGMRGLTRLERLCIDRNAIDSLGPIAGLPCLQSLSAKDNALEKVEDVAAALTCPTLMSLDLRGNAVAKAEFGAPWTEQRFELLR